MGKRMKGQSFNSYDDVHHPISCPAYGPVLQGQNITGQFHKAGNKHTHLFGTAKTFARNKKKKKSSRAKKQCCTHWFGWSPANF